MIYNASYHRNQRLEALARWADVGVLEKRSLLPIEMAFATRVAQHSATFFRPLVLNDIESVSFHREISYLIDAFDSLPSRVDIAFDSTWKAFELETKSVSNGNATDRLRLTAEVISPDVIDLLCANVPVQSCEYLFARLVTDVVEETVENGLKNRLIHSTDEPIRALLDHLRLEFGGGDSARRRQGTLLLRRALRGEVVKLGAIEEFRLESTSKARILISLFLYTTRNERFHGSSFSPFISSAASLRTYTHPYFAFLSSYYLLLGVWLVHSPQALDVGSGGVEGSIRENFTRAKDIFGRHWDK